MIVCKFGGTSIGDPAAIKRLVEIVRERRAEQPVLVLSALSKATDALLGLEGASPANLKRRLEAIVARHRAVSDELGLPEAPIAGIEGAGSALLEWATARAGQSWNGAERDRVASHGELWSTRLVAAALEVAGLPAVWVDARRLIATDATFQHAVPDQPEITRRAAQIIPPLLADGAIPVTQGFVGSSPDGQTTTLGRGGSDFTASLLAAALGAERVEIWTDVDGILSADPRIVPEAQLLPEASYHEAAELAAFGAKVLHPATQMPLIAAGIPCWVRNSFAPERPGTRIVAGVRPSLLTAGSPVRSIAWKPGITIVNVRAPRSYGAVGFLHQFFGAFAKHGIAVDVLASTEISVSVTIDDQSRLPALVQDLEALGREDLGVLGGNGHAVLWSQITREGSASHEETSSSGRSRITCQKEIWARERLRPRVRSSTARSATSPACRRIHCQASQPPCDSTRSIRKSRCRSHASSRLCGATSHSRLRTESGSSTAATGPLSHALQRRSTRGSIAAYPSLNAKPSSARRPLSASRSARVSGWRSSQSSGRASVRALPLAVRRTSGSERGERLRLSSTARRRTAQSFFSSSAAAASPRASKASRCGLRRWFVISAARHSWSRREKPGRSACWAM